MVDYENLDINQKINLKALVKAWQEITVERFQADLTSKLYGRPLSVRTTKKGVQSSQLGGRYRFGMRGKRTFQLRDNWRSGLTGSEARMGSRISFLQYGRFVDMGVGKGTDYALSKYQSIAANGEKRTRKPVRWYSKRKAHETHRLRELLVKYHIDVPLETIENALTTRTEITL